MCDVIRLGPSSRPVKENAKKESCGVYPSKGGDGPENVE